MLGRDRGLAAMVRRPTRCSVLLFALAGATVLGLSFAPSQNVIFAKLGVPNARQTCFLNEIHHPQARRIAEATVFIAVVRSDGTLASEGTGFVVSDSSSGGAQGQRIVTAAHVVDGIDATHNGQRLMVFFSDGMPLGLPRTIVGDARRDLSAGGFDLVANDIAVLEIASFDNDAARDRFLGLSGLPLDGSGDILVGETSQPPWRYLGLFGSCCH